MGHATRSCSCSHRSSGLSLLLGPRWASRACIAPRHRHRKRQSRVELPRDKRRRGFPASAPATAAAAASAACRGAASSAGAGHTEASWVSDYRRNAALPSNLLAPRGFDRSLLLLLHELLVLGKSSSLLLVLQHVLVASHQRTRLLAGQCHGCNSSTSTTDAVG